MHFCIVQNRNNNFIAYKEGVGDNIRTAEQHPILRFYVAWLEFKKNGKIEKLEN